MRPSLALVLGLACGGSPALAAAEAAGLPGYRAGGLVLQTSLAAGLAFLPQQQAWFGRSSTNVGAHVDHWWEGFATPGLDAAFASDAHGTFHGRISAVGAFSGGVDGAGSDVDDTTPRDLGWEDAHLGWRSGTASGDGPSKGVLAFSFGRQTYTIGSGLLIADGNTTDGPKGALYLGPRTAFKSTATADLALGPVSGRAFFLEPEDDPGTGTRLAGIDLGHALATGGCDATAAIASCLAGGYYKVIEADDPARDGMGVLDLRADLRPLATAPGIRLAGELVHEENGSVLRAYAWYGELGYAADDLAWSPYLGYRYAIFSGDDPGSQQRSEAFDPLYYDGPDYGTWTQGLILGNYVLGNSNLVSHTLRLRLEPTASLTLNLLYYHFRLDDPESAGVSDHDFAQEIDLALDYALSANLTLSLTGAVLLPEDGARQLTGGDAPWSQLVLSAAFGF